MNLKFYLIPTSIAVDGNVKIKLYSPVIVTL